MHSMQLSCAASPHAEHMLQVGVRGYLVCGWQSEEGLVQMASGINIGSGESWAVHGLLVLPTWYHQKGACACYVHFITLVPPCLHGR